MAIMKRIKNILTKKYVINPANMSETQKWYAGGGKAAIEEIVRKYRGRGIGQLRMSNFDICPWEVYYDELARLISVDLCPAQYVEYKDMPGQEDIVMWIDSAKGGVQNG